MYVWFTAAFREAFGVPLAYAQVLQSPMRVATWRDEDWMDADPLSSEVASAKGDEDLSSDSLALPGLLNELGVDSVPNSHQQHFPFSDDSSPSEPPLSPVQAPIHSNTRTCSTCQRSFEKSKSHKGTLCWSCKKRASGLPTLDDSVFF